MPTSVLPVCRQSAYLCGMVSACAALVAACALAGMLGALGLPEAGSPTLFAAFTLAAALNPACAALLPLLIPVRRL